MSNAPLPDRVRELEAALDDVSDILNDRIDELSAENAALKRANVTLSRVLLAVIKANHDPR